MNTLTEIPRCHYCQRFAPEIYYKNIAICPECLDAQSAIWRAYRKPDGVVWITDDDPENLIDWELIETGAFSELWAKWGGGV